MGCGGGDWGVGGEMGGEFGVESVLLDVFQLELDVLAVVCCRGCWWLRVVWTVAVYEGGGGGL